MSALLPVLKPAVSPVAFRTWWRQRMALLTMLGLSLTAACQGDGLAPGRVIGQAELYWRLTLNHQAVTLSTTAPYDTLTLVATARRVDGTAITGVPAPTFKSSDSRRVAVTPEGVIHSVAPTNGTVVILATLTIDNLKHVDSVIVKVTDEPAPQILGSFSIHPVPPDSAKVAVWNVTTCFRLPLSEPPPEQCRIFVPVTVLDTAGVPIPAVPVMLRSSDPSIIDVRMDGGADGVIDGYRPGSATFYASTTIFGVAKADTLPFRVGLPVSATAGELNPNPGFLFPPEIKVGTGATVGWFVLLEWWYYHQDGDWTFDVTFADPTNVIALGEPVPDYTNPYTWPYWCQSRANCNEAGNIVLNAALPYAARRFPVAGTYEYHSNAMGVGGRIVVVDESQP